MRYELTICPECAERVEDAWRFCRACGADLVPANGAEPPSEPADVELVTEGEGAEADGRTAPSDGWLVRHRRRVALVVVAAVIVAAIAAAATWAVRTRGDLADTKESLATTQATLADTRDELESTTAELQQRTAERDQARAELASTRGELESTRTELGGVRQSLSDARNELNLQAGQIETLKTCLGGVSDALVYVADFAYSSAVAALRAVQVACQSAFELF